MVSTLQKLDYVVTKLKMKERTRYLFEWVKAIFLVKHVRLFYDLEQNRLIQNGGNFPTLFVCKKLYIRFS